jgi:hypothetical protein
MQRESIGLFVGRLAVLCVALTIGAVPLSYANEAHAPVVAKKALAPGETKTLNPQPIPPGKSIAAAKASRSGGESRYPSGHPGKSAATTNASRNGGEKSIIFVGGKKVKTH